MLIGLFFLMIMGVIPLFLKSNSRNKDIYYGELVSLIIPVFNDGDILEKNLENLLKLKYPNFEIIIVYSEKSTDNTQEVALRFARKYENVRAYSENISKANALNIGIEKAKGEFLLFLDSDSLILDGFIEDALSYFDDDDIKLVNGCPIGLNATQNLTTRLCWSITNFISFCGIGANKLFKHVGFQGFGGIWRKSALIECGMFKVDSATEDSELNLRISSKFPKWKGVFGNHLYCYYYYPTDFTALYLQLERWSSGNLSYISHLLKNIFGNFKMGFRHKFIYISQFTMTILLPIISWVSIGMSIVQFFVNFFEPDISFGGGLFFFLLGIISLIISFLVMLIFTYPKYYGDSRIKLSKTYIIIGVFGIVYLIGLIFGIASLNALKRQFFKKKTSEIFYKVDKSNIQTPHIS